MNQRATSLYKMSGLVLCKMRVNATSCCPPGCFCTALYVAYLATSTENPSCTYKMEEVRPPA